MPLPSGTVTFLFTDVEESTPLVERLGPGWPPVLEEHRRLLRDAIVTGGGEIVDSRGEEMLAAFSTARAAVGAALAAQRAHAQHPWPEDAVVRVRIGLHTGEPTVADAGYLGLDVHRGARICACAHGGQVLLSQTTRDLVGDEEVLVLGEVALKGISRPVRLFQLVAADLPQEFPPPRLSAAAPAVEGREHELAAAVTRRRLPHLLPRRHRNAGLAELGWHLRDAMPLSRDPAALAALAGELFAAGRSAADADAFLARTDRRVLVRRRDEHRRLGVLSHRAGQEAEALHHRLGVLDELERLRGELESDARAVEAELQDFRDPAALGSRLRETTARLDRTLEAARSGIGDSALRLHRTPWRGVYRNAHRFVVPTIDEVGIEHVHSFETSREARAFAHADRIKHKRQDEFTGPRMPPFESGGMGGE